MTKEFIEKIESYNTLGELYSQFGIIYDDYINEMYNKGIISNSAFCRLKEDYINNEFEDIRRYIEDKTFAWSKSWDDESAKFVVNPVVQTTYQTWKTLDNYFTLFYEKYFEIVENNLV